LVATILFNIVHCSKRVALDAFGDPAKRDKESAFARMLLETILRRSGRRPQQKTGAPFAGPHSRGTTIIHSSQGKPGDVQF
jgi:hypothetical protein